MHGWQSESADGPKGGWSCAFWSGFSGHPPTTAECYVVWCYVVVVWSCSCSVVAVAVAAVVVLLFNVVAVVVVV